MRWTRPYTVSALAAVVVVALLLTLSGRPLAAQQAQYEVMLWPEPAPLLDPDAPEWNDVPRLEVPLIPQGSVIPTLRDLSVPSATVQAAHDGATIVFRFEWQDDTRDVEAGRPDQFGDAAALQFPVGEASPAICMGAAGQLSNIWHWKAVLQEDLDQGFQDLTRLYPGFFKDHYPYVTGEPPFRFPEDFTDEEARAFTPAWAVGNPMVNPLRITPVENLVAVGFGTLTGHPRVEVGGTGRWADGRWRVVFTRDMGAPDDRTVSFAGREQVPVAIGIWNGANEEVGARKQHSTYLTFSIAAAEVPLLENPWFYTAVAAAILAAILGGALLYLRGKRTTTDPASAPRKE